MRCYTPVGWGLVLRHISRVTSSKATSFGREIPCHSPWCRPPSRRLIAELLSLLLTWCDRAPSLNLHEALFQLLQLPIVTRAPVWVKTAVSTSASSRIHLNQCKRASSIIVTWHCKVLMIQTWATRSLLLSSYEDTLYATRISSRRRMMRSDPYWVRSGIWTWSRSKRVMKSIPTHWLLWRASVFDWSWIF